MAPHLNLAQEFIALAPAAKHTFQHDGDTASAVMGSRNGAGASAARVWAPAFQVTVHGVNSAGKTALLVRYYCHRRPICRQILVLLVAEVFARLQSGAAGRRAS
jgi:hypothetical protein